MNIALVLAAGSGTRMQSALPKQFLPIDGEPIYIRSIRRFAECGEVDAIVLAAPADYLSHAARQIETYFPGREIPVIPGGADRPETMERLIDFVFQRYEPDETSVLLTHDAVRPFIDSRIIHDNIAAAREYGGCGTVIPAVDTVFCSEDGAFVTSVPARSKLYYAQTPQSFLAVRFRDALKSLSADEKTRVTDACSVFILCGLPVRMVTGRPENIKITYPADLASYGGNAHAEADRSGSRSE